MVSILDRISVCDDLGLVLLDEDSLVLDLPQAVLNKCLFLLLLEQFIPELLKNSLILPLRLFELSESSNHLIDMLMMALTEMYERRNFILERIPFLL